MKNQSIITISTVKGSYRFQLSRWQTIFLKATFLFICLSLLSALFNLFHLSNKIDSVAVKEKMLINQTYSLNSTIENLNREKKALQQDLTEREHLLSNASLRLDELEEYLVTESNTEMQLKPTGDTGYDLIQRLDNATISSAVRNALFTLIPNGEPVKNARLSSRYGYRTHPITHKKRMHRGLDFAVNTGTPVYATADGVVEITRKSQTGSGNFMRIQHSFGFSSSFSHLQAFKVANGEFVEKGQLVAISGNTGISSGPHLHYEVRFIGKPLNPITFVQWNNKNFESIFEKEKKVKWAYLLKKVEQKISNQLQLLSQVDTELLALSNLQQDCSGQGGLLCQRK
ncbi:M23 family metallopeptidase [Psychromonas sp.]|uniref:M23 family metallopeptidase n=1 Tax=Psychromonas sp. TaxID=1884585 RepID=UPI003566E437